MCFALNILLIDGGWCLIYFDVMKYYSIAGASRGLKPICVHWNHRRMTSEMVKKKRELSSWMGMKSITNYESWKKKRWELSTLEGDG